MKKILWLACLMIFLLSCETTKKKRRYANDYLSIAISFIKKCDYKRAVIQLLKAVSFEKKEPLLRHTLASTYFLMGNQALAAKEYKKALSFKKNFTEARVDLARSYIERNMIKKALNELNIAEKDITYTNYIKLVGTKGLAFFKKAEYEKAKKQFMEMKRLASESHDKCFAFLYLGRMELNKGYLNEAETYFIKSLTECQKSTPVCKKRKFEEQYFLAETYRKKKDFSRMKYQLKTFIDRTDESNPYRKKALARIKQLKKQEI